MTPSWLNRILARTILLIVVSLGFVTVLLADDCSIAAVVPNPKDPKSGKAIPNVADGNGTWNATNTFISVYFWCENNAPPNTQSRSSANTNPNPTPPTWDGRLQLAAGNYDSGAN